MATEVFNNIGEVEIYSGNPNFYKYKRQREENDNECEDVVKTSASNKIESTSKPLSDAKKEFFEHLEKDSLTIDSCDKLNRDWKKK